MDYFSLDEEEEEYEDEECDYEAPLLGEYYNQTITDRAQLEEIVSSLGEHRRRAVVASLIRTNGLLKHQFDSYERFLHEFIQQIVHENSTLTIDCDDIGRRQVVQFEDIAIQRPVMKEAAGETRKIYPKECKDRKLTYACTVLVNVRLITYDITDTTPALCSDRLFREVQLCQLPVMVRSKACHLSEEESSCSIDPTDPGGYFVVKGSEKVIISQEGLKTNYPYVFAVPNKGSYVCEIRCSHEHKMRSTSTLYCHMTQVRNTNPLAPTQQTHAVPTVHVCVPFLQVKNGIPLMSIYRMLGFARAEDIVEMITSYAYKPEDITTELVDLLRTILQKDVAEGNDAELYEWVGKQGTKETNREKRYKCVQHIMANEFLPHIALDNTKASCYKKAYFLSFIVYKLCRVALLLEKPDNRDHLAEKRYNCAGNLMGLKFRQLFRNLLKCLNSNIKKNMDSGKIIDIPGIINAKTITSGFKYAMATGNWGVQKGGSSMTGIAQVHMRMTFGAGLSNMRRVNTQINKQRKMAKPRQLHISHWFLLCPSETPEGQSTGLIKNLALSTHVRAGYASEIVVDVLQRFDYCYEPINCTPDQRQRYTMVFVNGVITHMTDKPRELVRELRLLRRSPALPYDLTIAYTPFMRKIRLQTDAGCLCRPIFIIENLPRFAELYECYEQHLHLLWQQLLYQGIIEYVDKEEEATLRIAVFPRDLLDWREGEEPYTHVEIHPVLMFGVCASLIPCSNHNQGPRNTYQCAMSKQAVGFQSCDLAERSDTIYHELIEPEVPLVQTMMDQCLGSVDRASGVNAMVAVCVYEGYNMEDSIILNQSSIDRGLFRSMVLRTYTDEEKVKGTDSSKFERPDEKTRGMRKANYLKLNTDGYAPPGTRVSHNDVLLGKTMNTEDLIAASRGVTKVLKRDCSVLSKCTEDSTVLKVLDTKNQDCCPSRRLTTLTFRTPEIGDKFSSRHGQKGTVGMVERQENMPYTLRGETPDIIINPHAFPTRMTVGMLVECLLGKVAAQAGRFADGTPFNDIPDFIGEIAKVLHSQGRPRYGKERMMCGKTGVMMDAMCFYAPCYYQRLKHMVADKAHGRARGPVQILTRQPVEGRSRDGGTRFGEMERDCLIGHGAAYMLKERLMEQSDAYITVVCQQCGLFAEPAKRGTPSVRAARPFCRNCNRYDTVCEMKIPYGCKLFFQEEMALNIAIRMRFKTDENYTTVQQDHNVTRT